MDNKDKTNNREGEVIDKIREIVDLVPDGECIYRGQPDIDYPHVSSTLYRALEKRYKESDDEWREWLDMEHDMNRVQEGILEDARWFASEDYKDKEMLSNIQHYSGDTNLIDFTKDCYIALFFACSQKGGDDGGKAGEIFLLKKSNLQDSEKGSEIKIITPAHPSNRVTAQKSVFVQSRTGIIPGSEMESIEISLGLKQPILDYLRVYHGISEYTIYNDLHGYIRKRKADGNAVIEGYLGFNYGNKSDKAQLPKEKDDALKKAIEQFDKAIRLAPNYVMAYYNRGVTKGTSGDMLGAIRDYDKTIELKPGYAAAYNNRGAAKNELGDNEGAIRDYDKAIEMSPDDASAYNNRGVAKKNRGNIKRESGDLSGVMSDYEDALSDYDKAIALKPDYAAAYNNRGVVKGEVGDNEGAISDCNKAIALNPNEVDAYNNRGIAKMGRGDVKRKLGGESGAISDYKDALSDYDKVIALKPDYASAYYNRGNAKEMLGDRQNLEQAFSDFEYAKELALQENKKKLEGFAQESIERVKGKIAKL